MHQYHIPRAFSVLLGSVILLGVRPAASSTIVFTCAGALNEASGINHDVFNDSVQPGIPFTAAFAIASSAKDDIPGNPSYWDYIDHNPLNEAYIRFGDYELAPDPESYALNSMSGTNDTGIDSYVWESYNSSGSGLSATWIHASLQDNLAQALTAKGLPPVGPGINDFSKWGSGEVTFMASSSTTRERTGWGGHITSISTRIQETPVPEPGSLSLLAAAVLPFLGVSLKRRRQ